MAGNVRGEGGTVPPAGHGGQPFTADQVAFPWGALCMRRPGRPESRTATGEEPAVHVQEWLDSVPAVAVYAVVGLVIGLESLGIPLPGEIVLVSAALMSSQHSGVNLVILGACATAGAVIGDSVGYAIGRQGRTPAAGLAGQKVPAPLQRGTCGHRRAVLRKWGMWAVFFGRFVALLRLPPAPRGRPPHAVLEVPGV